MTPAHPQGAADDRNVEAQVDRPARRLADLRLGGIARERRPGEAGPLVVCGSIRGDGRVGGALRMAASAEWEGEIHAQAAVIAGKITGRLVVEDKLEVGMTAVIRADIVTRSIAVAKGAVIDGAVTVTSGEPVLRFEEKRHGQDG